LFAASISQGLALLHVSD
jgi:hypothetical protein